MTFQYVDSTTTTTMSPVTVVCFDCHYECCNCFNLVEFQVGRMDTTRDIGGFISLPEQQPQSQIGQQDSMPVVTKNSAYYAKSLPQVSSLSEMSLPPIYVGVMVFAFHFCAMMFLHSTPMVAQLFGSVPHIPAEHIHERNMCLAVLAFGPFTE